jgi:hypothetical protein
MDEYFNKRIESHMDDIYRYMMTNNKGIFSRIIYPVFPKMPVWLGKIWRFLYRKTKWKCFITGYECNGVFYDKHTPEEQMGPKEEPKPVEFRRYIPLSVQREECEIKKEEKQNERDGNCNAEEVRLPGGHDQ